MVRELTMSASLATRNRYRLDWTGNWELETPAPFYSPDDPAPLTVLDERDCSEAAGEAPLAMSCDSPEPLEPGDATDNRMTRHH
jgi:hypothetical protein